MCRYKTKQHVRVAKESDYFDMLEIELNHLSQQLRQYKLWLRFRALRSELDAKVRRSLCLFVLCFYRPVTFWQSLFPHVPFWPKALLFSRFALTAFAIENGASTNNIHTRDFQYNPAALCVFKLEQRGATLPVGYTADVFCCTRSSSHHLHTGQPKHLDPKTCPTSLALRQAPDATLLNLQKHCKYCANRPRCGTHVPPKGRSA